MKGRSLLPTVAMLLLTVGASPVASAQYTFTTTPARVLDFKLIAEDDQVRSTGVVVLGLNVPAAWPLASQDGKDYQAQYKFSIALDGKPVMQTLDYRNLIINCQVVLKSKVEPLLPQFATESVKTVVTDLSSFWVCKPRFTLVTPTYVEAAGVLDVYYVGPQQPQFIGDYVLVISAVYTIPAARPTLRPTLLYGMAIGDICMLGWSIAPHYVSIPKPTPGDFYDSWDDALGPFAGCEDAVMWQRYYAGVPISLG